MSAIPVKSLIFHGSECHPVLSSEKRIVHDLYFELNAINTFDAVAFFYSDG